MVVFDDVHWAEPGFLDIVEEIAAQLRSAAVLMVCLARPELLDQRPSWGGGIPNAGSLLLEPFRKLGERTIGRVS